MQYFTTKNTMRRFFILLPFLFILSFQSFSQTATEEAWGKACDCFNSVNFNEIAYKYINLKADSCIQEALYTNLTGVLKENNLSIEDDEAMFQVAKRIGAFLSDSCKGFQMFSSRLAERKVEEVKKNNPSDSGLLYELKTNEILPTFVILTDKNEALEFVWFREFEGSTRFLKGIKDYQNTIVTIIWQELELFDVQTKKYKIYKEILLLEETDKVDEKGRKDWILHYKRK